MKAFVKAAFVLLVLVSSNVTTKAQTEFIDSIRTMLADLNEQVQYTPINQLLTQAIPYCTGDTMNDSLTVILHQLFSTEYFFKRSILQPVSPHLFKKYALFIQRIASYCLENAAAEDHEEKFMMMAIAKANLTGYGTSKEILLQLLLTKPLLRAKWLYFLAEISSGCNKPDSAFILYGQSLSVNPNNIHKERYFYKETLHQYAEFCRTHNKPDSALDLLEDLLNELKKPGNEDGAEYAFWLMRVANSYIYMAKYPLALKLDLEALEITQNTIGEETNQYAVCLTEIGEIYYKAGEYKKSLLYTQRALDLKRKVFGKDYFDNVISLHNLATLYTRMGLYNEAIPLFIESLAISKKYFGEDIVYAFDLHPLAEVYESLGEYDKALPLYQKALAIQEQPGKANFYYPKTLHSIASLFTKLGQYDKAIDLFKETLELKAQVFGRLNPEYSKTLNSYAEACLQKSDYKNALSLQKLALDINKELFGDMHPSIASGFYNLAALYYYQHKLHTAEEFCNSALRLQIKLLGQAHPDVARTYDLLGDINQQLNLYKAAQGCYLRAFEIRKKAMNATNPDYIQSQYNLTTIYIKERKIDEATRLLIQADSASLLHIKASYGSLSEQEKLVYLHSREKQFQYLPSLVYLRKITSPEIVNRVYTNAITLKSMVLFHQQQVYNNIRKSGDSTALKLYSRWRLNMGFLGQQILLPPEKRLPDFDSLSDLTNQLEGELSHASSTFRNTFLYTEAGVNRIVQHLSENEAAVEFIRFRLYNNRWTDSIIYAALVLLPHAENAVFVPLFEETQLQKLMQYSNSGEAAISYLYPPANKETPVSSKLYKLIWKPVQALLHNINTVYYSPCGLLYRISFPALRTEHKELLIEKFNLRQLLNTKSLEWPVEENTGYTTASIWGGVDYNMTVTSRVNISPRTGTGNAFFPDSSHKLNIFNRPGTPGAWQSLPGTKTETEKILLLLNEGNITGELKSDSAASEEAFKKMDGASPGLIHIATHGFFLPPINTSKTKKDLYEINLFRGQQNPMFRSGLILAGANKIWTGQVFNQRAEDGVLTAFEISQLDLSNTRLITLSACETALGDIEEDNEGVYGLQRALKMAGAKQILTSLWKVPDEQTTELMVMFYNSILRGNNENDALRNAQLVMKEKYAPYYWAGFVLSE